MANGKSIVELMTKHLGEGGSVVWSWYGGGTGWYWCQATVCWAFAKIGLAKLFYGGKKVNYCPTGMRWCKANLAQVPLEMADAGDIVYFDWDNNNTPNHVGFIEKRGSHNVAYTIEGNTNNSKFARRERSRVTILAIYRPCFVLTTKPTTYKLKLDGKVQMYSIRALQHALKLTETGALTLETVKAFQKKVGTAPDGAWGTGTSKAAQSFLKKKGHYEGDIDGDFGFNSQKALQSWINAVNYPRKTVVKESKIVETIKKLAWASSTAYSKYSYKSGKPTAAFKVALHKVYPNYKNWSTPAERGASCDVAVGTVLRSSGFDSNVPRGGGFGYDSKSDEQWGYFEKSKKYKRIYPKKYTDLQKGDICIVCKNKHKHTGHVWFAYGGEYIAEAAYGRFYFAIRKKAKARFKMSGTKRFYRPVE